MGMGAMGLCVRRRCDAGGAFIDGWKAARRETRPWRWLAEKGETGEEELEGGEVGRWAGGGGEGCVGGGGGLVRWGGGGLAAARTDG